MEKITAPFTIEQVEQLNQYQKNGKFHPFTCCSPEDIPECNRANKSGQTFEEQQGILIATTNGWICPCGKYTQDWAHKSMAEPNPSDVIDNFKRKYEEGFTKSEIIELVKNFPNINMESFNNALFAITAPMINNEIVIYPWDVKLAIRCGLENRNPNEYEID